MVSAAVCLAQFATPALASPGRLGGGGGVDVSLTRIIMAFVLGTMLAVFAAVTIKRGGGRFDMAVARRLFVTLPSARRIQVIESRRVSQHADLCLVRCDGEEYLILSSAQQQQILRASASRGAANESATGVGAGA
jgi:hypothetical protein